MTQIAIALPHRAHIHTNVLCLMVYIVHWTVDRIEVGLSHVPSASPLCTYRKNKCASPDVGQDRSGVNPGSFCPSLQSTNTKVLRLMLDWIEVGFTPVPSALPYRAQKQKCFA